MAGEGSDEELEDARETLDTGGGPPVAGGSTAAGGKPAVDLKVALKKRRAAAKGWVTRAMNNATKILDSRKVSKFAVQRAISDIDRRISTLEDVQAEYELELEEEEFETECDTINTYVNSVLEVRVKLEDLQERFRTKGLMMFLRLVVKCRLLR